MTADVLAHVPDEDRPVDMGAALVPTEVLDLRETPWADDEDGYDREDQR